ncbi:MAG: acyl-CoA dehydrogenase family protein [Deltaproteobacteria bacterium]|nr:acyl-CoA dehydrogenase family protein [Deltaproteobacteria bacterium]
MTTPYTESHDLFRKTVRDFCEKELRPHVDAWEKDELFPRWVFERAGELGILGAHYPEAHGGSGGDYWYSVAKAEELPRMGCGGVPMALMVQSDMATPVISDLGTPAQIDEFLKPALRGERISAIGVTEPGCGSDVAAMRTWARVDGDDYVINGSKTFITNGTRADFITLMLKTQPEAGHGGISIVLFPTDVKGFHVSKKLEKIGNWSSDTAELFFEDCRVPRRNLLGEEGEGFRYLMQNFQSERLIASVAACAGARLTLDEGLAYGRERVAFGKPILKREYWQHRFVDLLTKLEAGHALTYRAVDAYNTERYVKKEPISFDTTKLISMAKVFVGDVASEVVDQVLQFHGGWGYVEDFHIARAWRDQRLFRIGGGTTETLRYYLAKLLGL